MQLNSKFKPLSRFSLQKQYVLIGVAVVAVIGTISVILSHASPAPGSVVIKARDQAQFVSISTQTVDANTSSYKQGGLASFNVQYPSAWKAYQYKAPSTDSVDTPTDIRLLAPGTVVGGETHDGELIISQGALVEIVASPNNQYLTTDQYLDQLGDNLAYKKPLVIAGQQAVEFRLSSSFQEEGRPRIITTFFRRGVQYSISFAAATEELTNPNFAVYQQIRDSFTLP